MQWSVGQVVRSKQGRDQAHYYVIIKTEEKCCFLADGRKVTVEKPKKKNYKHLQGTLTYAAHIKENIGAGRTPNDGEIREFLNHHWQKDGTKEESVNV